MKTALFLFSFLFANQALAAVSFCSFTDAELNARDESCGYNEVSYGAAAVECVQGFQREADRVSKELVSTMVGGHNAGLSQVSGQREYDGSAESNYKNAKERLGALIREGVLARNRVKNWGGALAVPEDYDHFRTSKYLNNSACYSETSFLLRRVTRDFDAKIAELRSAYEGAFGREAQSGVSKARLRRRSADTKLATAKSAPPVKAEKSAQRPAGVSDITGTKPPIQK
ncbi:MAG: hypothetical protein ACXVB9_01815 [Bdellovibrionota bacterium]